MSFRPLRDVETPGRAATSSGVFWIVALVGLALAAAPLRLMPPPAPAPVFAFLALYFWMVFRTQSTPIWAGLVIGLLQDASTGGAWGVGPAAYALATMFIWTAAPTLRRERFGALWIGAGLAASAYALGLWFASCVAARTWLSADPFLMQAAVTTLVHPIFHRLFTALDAVSRRMGH